MAPKRKKQRTISAMFAWKPSNNTNEIYLNNYLHEDIELFETNLESLTEDNSSKISNEKPKRWVSCDEIIASYFGYSI